MFRKFELLIVIILITTPLCTLAEDSAKEKASIVYINLAPSVEIPLGMNSDYFGTGGACTLKAGFTPAPVPLLSFIGEMYYQLHPYAPEQFFTSFGGGGGLGLNFQAGDRLHLSCFASGGYSSCRLELANEVLTGGGTYISGGLSGDFFFNPLFSMGIAVSYRNIFGVYSGVSASVGAALDFSIKRKTNPAIMGPLEGNYLKLLELQFSRVFPVFYSYYDDHPMGKAVLFNTEEKSIEDITVSLFVNKYMDAPKLCVSIDNLAAGESRTIEIKALFTENLLEITEGMKVAAEIMVEYQYDGERYRDTHTESMQIEFRNAMTWDDDRKAAAFVTAKDPDVLSTSKNVAGILKNIQEYNVNNGLLMAMAFHETLRLYGMSYVIDPSTPYESLSKNELSVDYLQFPRETLEYRAGDCDDLSILYCALFESVGIETAFITVPGHIYMAFSTGMKPEEAKRHFAKEDELIFRDGKSWIPVEITCLEDDFLKAWQLGAKEWREFEPKGLAGFFQIHEAWETYRPIGLPGRSIQLVMPEPDTVSPQIISLVKTYVEREIFPQVISIEEKISNAEGAKRIKYMNNLGVLYARYGLDEKALHEFNKVLLLDDYVPSLINIGNIYFLEQEMGKALPYYEKALELEPDNKKALIYVASVNHELENYAIVNDLYSKLKLLDAELAEDFAYLDLRSDEGTRASDITAKQGIVLWEEE